MAEDGGGFVPFTGVREMTDDSTESPAGAGKPGAAHEARPEASWHASLFRYSLDAIVSLDREGRFLEANPAAERLSGYTQAQLRGMTFEQLCVPEVRLRARAAFQKQIEGVSEDVEVAFIGRDGARKDIYITGGPIMKEGSICGLFAIVKDVTARRQAEAAAREMAERLKLIHEYSQDMIYSRDLRTDRYEYVSPAYERISGYTAAEFIQAGLNHLLERIHPDDLEASRRTVERILVERRPHGSAEYRFRCKDGTYRWFFDSFSVVRDDGGRPTHWVGVVRDVTDRKRVEEQLRRLREELEQRVEVRTAELKNAMQALRKSEALFRQMTTTIRQVFWIQDVEQSRILYLSPAFEEIWGRTCESIYADPSSWIEMLHPEDRERVLASARTARTGDNCEEEFRILHPDGAIRWIRMRLFPVRDESGRIVRLAGCSEDVTERKRLEREILEISDREQRRIGRDLHDGLCQLLVGTSLKVDALSKRLDDLHLPDAGEARRIRDLLADALTQAQGVAKGLSPVELDSEGLCVALEQMASTTGRLFGVSCSFSSEMPVPVYNPDTALHLYRIAQEAVTNAVRHGRPRHIVIGLNADPQTVILTVEDDGVGMADGAQNGQGIGLQIMGHRARMIGATLDIRRRHGVGTTITCSCANAAPSPPAASPRAP